MSRKYITAVALGFLAIIGWNVFLIQRDNKMFEDYKNRHEQICEQMKSFHPDCHIE